MDAVKTKKKQTFLTNPLYIRRCQLGLTIAEVQLRSGVAIPTIRAYEAMNRGIEPATLKKLAEALAERGGASNLIAEYLTWRQSRAND